MLTRTAAFPAFTANWLGRWQYIHQVSGMLSAAQGVRGSA